MSLFPGLPLVTVVTPTRNRPAELARAMASVAGQRGIRVEHLVIGDDCPALADPSIVRDLSERFPYAVIKNVTGAEHAGLPRDYLPARLAALRNTGIAAANGDWIAQLDDDNEFEPDHLSSLLECLAASPGVEIAHSWRRLFSPDGSPYEVAGENPWHPDPELRASSYARLVELGVFRPGSSVVRDALRAGGEEFNGVDTSELLVSREMHERFPFPTTYSRWWRKLEWTEDYAWCVLLDRAKVPMVCSEKPTLRYFMGGYSNASVTR
ncbi:glycosyltransferase family 2 protein [Streptomyces guryensis]|uniref:Glycosyltransferase n=1 Tax=Streptomyces guryensis TaxID=2886947 RepID=A0A9Q3VZ06_9ACTN|nr:glycosyltransferase family A protein [Streptomyces guryensis]MCD9880204.1 glycosyltransferase [Streptomyces guryensis]